MKRLAAAVGLIGIIQTGPACAADAAAGKSLFARCQMCHTLDPNGPTMLGPNLHGLFGRKAGSLPGFNYSAAMKESGVVWDDGTLAKYLRDPKHFIPGNHMAFPGLTSDAELADLLAYLKEATK